MKKDLERLSAGFEAQDCGYTSPCWHWKGATDRHGYAKIKWQGKVQYAHRVLWENTRAPVPPGYDLDHLCRHRSCVNPDHLECVTHRENLMRGDTIQSRNAKKTECPRGHPYTDGNTRRNGRGSRECKICANLRRRTRNEKPG